DRQGSAGRARCRRPTAAEAARAAPARWPAHPTTSRRATTPSSRGTRGAKVTHGGDVASSSLLRLPRLAEGFEVEADGLLEAGRVDVTMTGRSVVGLAQAHVAPLADGGHQRHDPLGHATATPRGDAVVD